MKVVTKYIADDGTEFFKEKDCINYELTITCIDEVYTLFEQGASLYTCLKQLSEKAPDYLMLGDWAANAESLAAINKDSTFIISHWQCCETPVYSINRFKLDRDVLKLYVGGVGGWSGYYGNYISINEVLRFFERTNRNLIQTV